MTRNQKIALGCGVAVVLGLFVLIVAGVLGFYFYQRQAPLTRSYGTNYNSNRNYNSNSTSEQNTNSEADEASSSLSDDEKHRLFQAAGASQDNELIQRVLKKIGFQKSDGTMTEDYSEFIKGHYDWAMKNLRFMQSVNTPEKARAYVEAHIDD